MSAPRRDPKPRVTADPLNAPVIHRLPAWLDSPRRRGATFPQDIIAATIVNFGAAPTECDVEGGGLIIDYVPKGQTEPNRVRKKSRFRKNDHETAENRNSEHVRSMGYQPTIDDKPAQIRLGRLFPQPAKRLVLAFNELGMWVEAER